MAAQNILVVEQDSLQRGYLTAILRQAGYAVDAVATGAEAVRLRAQGGYALMVSEWRIAPAPGQDVPAAVPIEGYVIEHLDQGRHELLTRPAQAAELLDAVQRFIGRAIPLLILCLHTAFLLGGCTG